MKPSSHRKRQAGFTIIEMALALGLSIGIAAVIIGLLSQQVSFARALGQFSFLRDDAPQINTLMTNIINKSDNYRIYPDLNSALQFQNAVRSGGTAIRLRFRHPDGASDHAVIAFETRDDEKQLNYYFKRRGVAQWPGSPSWTISRQPEQVSFDNSSGILLITLSGGNGDEITYAGNPD